MGLTPLQAARQSYPGLLPAEICLLRSWLKAHEPEYTRFDYNVRVGPGTDPGPRFSDADRQAAIKNSQARIDAVGWKGSNPTLIEVKQNAGTSALGQLLMYNAHWTAGNPSGPSPALLLITDRVQANTVAAYDNHGIMIALTVPDNTIPGCPPAPPPPA